ncbi:hypothetical protein ACFQZE_08385 [Paenibacillus sp. GCM10027627]|uniref:hypothetical protein n=1 Tax=unclassified Paenibacillus TaxID=185978 RepID=UPI003635AD86
MSNKEYQKNVVGKIGGLDTVVTTGNGEFIVNARGGKIYKDLCKHKQLEITEQGNTYEVLSAGIHQWNGDPQAIATIQEGKETIVYLIPNDYSSWIDTLRANSMMGRKVLPAKVKFSLTNGRYGADIK